MKKAISTILASFITLATLFAQSPGGVSSSGSTQFWFAADKLSLSNNSPVVTWTDASGKGNNATTFAPNNRPIYKTSQINGKPSVVFDGVNDYFRTSAIPALNVGTLSYFIVFDGSVVTTTGVLLAGKYDSHNQFLMSYAGGANIKSWIIKLPNTTVASTVAKNAVYQMLSNTWTSATGVVNHFRDGVSYGNPTGATSVPVTNNYFSIGVNPASNNLPFKGGIAEVIMYSSKLNSAERIIIENYLAAKYNLTTANDFYAFETTHGNELIGIGQESDGSNASAINTTTTIQLSNMSTPGNGDYVMVGDNGTSLLPANTVDVPAAGWARYGKVWRSDITNTPGTVTVTFDVSTYSLGFTTGYQLLVDGDGVFATGATQYAGVYDLPTQTVTFTGVTLADGNYLTLANNNLNIESTGITTDWHTTTTWNCGCIPGIGSKVEVKVGHTVNINSATAKAGNLTINGTLAITANDSLFLDGNLVNNSTFNIGTGSIVFNSSSIPQTITGSHAFYNLTVDNSSTVTILSGASTIQGFLDVKTGSFATNNAVTMLSNATGSGAFKNPSAGSIVGDLTVQRYLNEGESWYLLASPLTNSTLEDWNGEFEMQGFPGTEWPTAPNASVYYYDETALVTSYYDGYKIPTNTSNIATNTVGWEAYIGNDSYGAIPKTINATGTPRLGNGIVINGTTSGALGDPSLDGWNLVGNPYQSPVLFLNVAKSANFDVAYRKKASGASQAINFTDIISPGEAIWLHCVGGPCSLTFDANDVNSTNIDNYNLRAAHSSDNLIVKLNYDNEYDEVEIDFNELATDNYDRGLDAYKLNNSFKHKPNLAIVNNQNHNLNKAVFNTDFNNSIPLRVYTTNPSGEDKKYSLSFENIANVLGRNKRIVLEDRQLNTFTELTSDVSVDFKMNDTEKTPRFYLNITTPLAILKQNITCFGANNGKIDVVTTDVKKITVSEAVTNSKKTILPSQGVSSITGLAPGKYKIVAETNQFGLVSDYITIEEPLNVQSEFVTINTEEILNGASLSSSSEVLQVKQNQRIEFKNLSANSDKYIWDFGDGITSNLVNPEHVYFKPGSYTVTLKSTNGNCSSISGKTINVEEKILLAESNLLEEVNVITNKNNIFVYMNNNNNIDNVKFEVLNAVGQVVYSSTKTLNNNHIENIYMNEASGLYFINIQGFGYSKTKKIVLN
ncbi:MAG: PKD domain-containing protein [Flavobacteriales bacterium]|nr:PKD domain-containing protein [Flavobacteriales bacterium]